MSDNKKRSGFRWGRTLLKVAVSGLLMFIVLRRISLEELRGVVVNMDGSLLLAAFLCFLCSNILGSFQWYQLLIASGVKLGFPQTFRFYFVGLFFNNFLPANIGGDAVKVYDVSRFGSSVYQVIAVTLLDRLLGIFGLCLLATLAVVYLLPGHGPDPYGFYLLIFMACMLPAIGFYMWGWLGRLLRRVVLIIRPLSLDERISSILDHLGEFKGRKQLVVGLVGLSIVIQTLRVSTHILVALAIGVTVDRILALEFFVIVPLLGLAMIPPITINGLGIREGLGMVLFAAAGVSQTDAFATEILTWAVSVVVSLLGFGFFLARRGSRGQQGSDGETVYRT